VRFTERCVSHCPRSVASGQALSCLSTLQGAPSH
jgi:hypothetical protein